jgi:hypothetical protein
MESSGYAAVLPDPSPALRIPLKTGLKAFGATIANLKAELIINE